MAIDTSRLAPSEKRRLIVAISKAIEHASIHCAPLTGWTDQMSREAFSQCLGIYEVLRREEQMSPPRACDELKMALRCYLEKVEWETSTSRSWVTADDTTPAGIILP